VSEQQALDEVLRDLGGWRPLVRSHPVRLALFGSDVGHHVGGLVLLVVLLPGLLALLRWATPRR